MLNGGVSLYCFPLQPCMVFAGEQFENDADFKLAKSMLLDMFRGRVVEKINLKVYSLASLYGAISTDFNLKAGY